MNIIVLKSCEDHEPSREHMSTLGTELVNSPVVFTIADLILKLDEYTRDSTGYVGV